jgi:hypothetical protein
MLEQFDEFSASVEIQDDALVLDRSTFRGLHAGPQSYESKKARIAAWLPMWCLAPNRDCGRTRFVAIRLLRRRMEWDYRLDALIRPLADEFQVFRLYVTYCRGSDQTVHGNTLTPFKK